MKIIDEWEKYSEERRKRRKSKFENRVASCTLPQKEIIKTLLECGLSIRKSMKVCRRLFHFNVSYDYVRLLKKELKRQGRIEKGIRNFPQVIWKTEDEISTNLHS